MTEKTLRRNIMLPITILIAFVVGAILFGVYSSQKSYSDAELDFKRTSVANLYKVLIEKDVEIMSGLLGVLTGSEKLVGPWMRGDIQALIAEANPLYTAFNSQYRITHFYFIAKDGVVDLRVHTPSRRGDKISRHTLFEASRTGRVTHGVEMGPLGTLTLRVVAPVRRAGAVVGYMELGEELGHVTAALKETMGVELAVLIDKKFLKEADWSQSSAFRGGELVPWEKLNSHVVTGLTDQKLIDPAAPLVEELIDENLDEVALTMGNRLLALSSVPISDASGVDVGSMVIFMDETDTHKALDRILVLTGLSMALFSGVVFLYFFYRTGKEEARVKEEQLGQMLEGGRQRLAEQQHYIAEISQARDTIHHQTLFLQLIIDTIPLPVFYKDVEGRYIGCNSAFERYFGKNRQDILGRTVSEIFPGHNEVHEAADDAILSGQKHFFYETQLPDGRGSMREVMITKARYLDPAEQSAGIVGVIFDLTESKEAKRELRNSEERLRSIFDNARMGILLLDAQGRILRVNSAFCDLLGYTGEELGSVNILELIDESDRAAAENKLELVRKRIDRAMDFEARFLAASKKPVHMSVTANWVVDAEGMPLYSVAIAEDIGDRLKAEEDRNRLAKAVEFADETIMVTDARSRILYVNPAFERITGYSCAEVQGRTPALLNSGIQDRDFYARLWETLRAGGVWRGKFLNRKKNGEIFEESATISSVRDAKGAIQYFVAVKRDTTREKELEASLRQAQKMEAVGTLASGVSHDFNNILHAITGFAQVLLSRGGRDERDREYLSLILDTAQRGADLVTQILTFSRANAPVKKPLDLNREIAEIMKMISKAVPKFVGFELGLSADLMPINATSDQLHQILMNLCANAWDAMPQGGVINVRTRNVPWSQELFADFPDAPRKNYVELSVRDTGMGMDVKTLERIYDPFFTTKPVGKGTGLGLATVYGIVKAHDGYITCNSSPGKGTEFAIYFPALADRRRAEVRDQAVEEELKGGTETVLLVDDEQIILQSTGELLESFGYNVLKVNSGEEAVELYASRRSAIDVVLLDLGMPGMGGRRCLEELLRLNGSVRVVICSGYDAKAELNSEGAKGYLRKPFRLSELLLQIRKALKA